MKRTSMLLALIIFSVAIQAQSLKTYSGEKTIKIKAHSANDLNCRETYQYYLGGDGSHIKSGSYSLSGNGNFNSFGPGDGAVTESYSVNATFKDGYLNGKLTAKMTVKGRMYFYSHEPYLYNVEVTLSGGFKNGVPDGQWVYTERGDANSSNHDDQKIYKSTFNCKDGKFVGDFDINFAYPEYMSVTKQKGKFNQKGKLLSLTMRGFKNYDRGVKEYTLSPDGYLLSYIQRNKNNQSEGYYKADDNLMKNYANNKEEWLSSLKENGYVYWDGGMSKSTSLQYECHYEKKETGCYGSYFSTAGIVNYIYSALLLNKNVDGIKESEGLFDSYPIIISGTFEKYPVKPLSEAQLEQLSRNFDEIQDISEYRSSFIHYYDFDFWDQKNIMEINGVKFLNENGILFYFTENQEQQYMSNYEENKKEKWDKVRKNLVHNSAKDKLSLISEEIDDREVHYIFKSVDSIWSSSDSLYHCKIILDYNFKTETEPHLGWESAEKEWIFTIKAEKGYNLFTGREGDVFQAKINDGWNDFTQITKIPNEWDQVQMLDEQIRLKCRKNASAIQEYEKASQLNYSLRKDKNKEEQLAQARTFIDFQNKFLDFIDKRTTISEKNTEITTNSGKDYADVKKSYMALTKDYKLDFTSDTTNNNSHLNNFIDIQDHCLSFIKLRKSISEKSTEITTNSGKDCADVKKSYMALTKDYKFDFTSDTTDNNSRLNNFIDIQNNCLAFIKLRKTISEKTTEISTNSGEDCADVKKSYMALMTDYKLDFTSDTTDNNSRLNNFIAIQDNCLTFIKLRKSISEKTTEISTNSGKDYADVKKSYMALTKDYKLDFTSDTTDNNSRLNNFIDIQDSCLTFIELRKNIAQNNEKIAGYSKSASNVVKAFNAYMKGIDFLWNQEAGRNQEIREIINGQNELLNVLSKPNISEMNTTVKKSKAKTWEEVKKIIFQ